MRQFAWVLGLGILGLLFFGSWGGTVGGALGYAIGSMTSTQSPSQSSPDRESHGTLAQWLFLLMFLSVLVGGFLVVLRYIWDDDKIPLPPAQVLEKGRPVVFSNDVIWSTQSCLQEHFGQAIASGNAVPPEVTFFCAYPWLPKELESLTEELEGYGITPITFLEQLANPPADIAQTIEIRKAIRDMPMPSSLLQAYELYQILPVVWGAQQSKPGYLKVLKSYFKDEFVKKLMVASKNIEWSTQVASQELIREHVIRVGGDPVRLLTSEAADVSVSEMVEVILGVSNSKAIENDIAKNFPSEGNVLRSIISNLMSQGLHAKHVGQLYLIETYIFSLQLEAQKALTESKITPDFRPVDRREQRQVTPLEIYWLRDSPSVWCGAAGVTEAGQYCEGEDRVYSRVAAQDAAGPWSMKSMLEGLGAVLLHELAHAYFNPQQSDKYPFVVEGIVTAYGERSMKAMLAAIPYMQSVNAKLLRFYLNTEGEYGASELSDNGETENLLNVEALSKKYITDTGYTPYAEKAICLLTSSPMDVDVVKAFLSMSSGTYRAQEVGHLNEAYAYGWGIFNFGLDSAGLGASISQDPLDASVVQRVAISMKQNKSIDADLNAKLVDFIAGVNKSAKTEVAARSIKCPRN